MHEMYINVGQRLLAGDWGPQVSSGGFDHQSSWADDWALSHRVIMTPRGTHRNRPHPAPSTRHIIMHDINMTNMI